jgi:hypothetical protein
MTEAVKTIKQSQLAAKKIEEEEDIDQLGSFTDFEWRIPNGKMSTLRWVLGKD